MELAESNMRIALADARKLDDAAVPAIRRIVSATAEEIELWKKTHSKQLTT